MPPPPRSAHKRAPHLHVNGGRGSTRSLTLCVHIAAVLAVVTTYVSYFRIVWTPADNTSAGEEEPHQNTHLPPFAFQSHLNVLVPSASDAHFHALIADCNVAFDDGASYWVSARDAAEEDAPSEHAPTVAPIALERIATRIFNHHTAHVDWSTIDKSHSGVEWWVQVRNNTHGDIAMHHDKDEAIFLASGEAVHPAISTVTYVGAAGAPTFIFSTDYPCSDDSSKIEPATRAASSSSSSSRLPRRGRTKNQRRKGGDHVEREPKTVRGTLSYPIQNKHVAFDGRFFHGALAHLALPRNDAHDVDDTGYYIRVTFLANIWLGRKPSAVHRWPDATRGAFTAPTPGVHLRLHPPRPADPASTPMRAGSIASVGRSRRNNFQLPVPVIIRAATRAVQQAEEESHAAERADGDGGGGGGGNVHLEIACVS